MTESGDTRTGREDGDASRPLFDPARERALERERARKRREGEERERWDRNARQHSRGEESDDHAAGSKPPRSANTGAERRVLDDGDTDASAGVGAGAGAGSKSRFASASDVTGRGVGLTLFGALLCALGYYGVLGIRAEGVQVFGSVVPVPFYTLMFSVLFVFSLVPRAHRGITVLAWSVVFSVAFGTLLAVGTEGIVYLADNPDVATAGYTGLTVLALAVVVASITYWSVLSVAKTA